MVEELVERINKMEHKREYVQFKLDAIPPSWNRFAGRQNQWTYRIQKNQWTERVAWAANKEVSKTMPWGRAEVIITYHFRDARRRDPDNFSGKFILDGLTEAGIITDDSFDVVTLTLQKGDKSSQPYTEVKVVRQSEDA